MKVKKFIIDAVLIIVALIIAYFFILLFLLSPFIEFGEPVMEEGEIYHITNVEDLPCDLNKPILSVQIESFDCYCSLQNSSLFADEVVAPYTGTITLTEENYQLIINKYSDWKEYTGFPPLNIGIRENMAKGLQEYACDDLKELMKNETYLFSEQLVIDEGMLCFVSKNSSKIYFYWS